MTAVHRSYDRNLEQYRRIKASSIMDPRICSFAAVGGDPYQRKAIMDLEAQKLAGTAIGVVCLARHPEMVPAFPEKIPVMSANPLTGQFSYDPLYGLETDEVINLIAPVKGEMFQPQIHEIRSALMDYLSILDFQFNSMADEERSLLFGQYPFSLDLLMDLTEMSFFKLEDRVLDYLPSNLQQTAGAHLSVPGLIEKVRAAVRCFGQGLYHRIWQPVPDGNGYSHTRISTVSALSSGQVIYIPITSDSQAVLSCVLTELRHLEREGIPFLLLCADADLSIHTEFAWFLLRGSEGNCFRTGLSMMDAGQFAGEDKANLERALNILLARFDEIFVFEQSGYMEAEILSRQAGQYLLSVEESHTDRSRAPLRLLPTMTKGVHSREMLYPCVRPEELMNLSQGCLILQRAGGRKILTEFLSI